MKSPFPGMDPYLEKHWRDIHARLITYGCDQLQPQLAGPLRARVEERVVVDAPGSGQEYGIYPDVRVIERKKADRGLQFAESGLAVAAPAKIIERSRRTSGMGM